MGARAGPEPKGPLQRGHEVAPLLLCRPVVDQPLDTSDDLTELGVVERPDQDHAGVGTLALGPLPRQRREVAAVARHENPRLLGGEFEHQRIIKPFERCVFSEREHIVATRSQWPPDSSRRQVRVQQQAHEPSGREPHERVQLAPLPDRTAVLCDRVRHLVGVALPIRERELDLAL